MTRTFENGSNRDTSNGKIDYFGFRHPLCEKSFGDFMLKNRKMKDGSFREPDNWWGGWDSKISIASLNRHLEELNAIESGLWVYHERIDDGETTHILQTPRQDLPENWTIVTGMNCANAIRFNADAYKLEILRGRPNQK